MHLIFVANSLSPNTVELYNTLHEHSDVRLEVVYLAKNNDKWIESEFPINHTTLSGINLSPVPSRINTAFCPGVLFKLLFARRGAMIIVQGYSNPTNFLLILGLALLHKKSPWAFWGERIKNDTSKFGIRRLIKKIVIFALSKSMRVYAVGKAGVDRFVEQGVPLDLLKSLPYTKDFSVYMPSVKTYDNHRLVVTSRLVASKNIDLLLKVFIHLSPDYPDWRLDIIGDGPLRTQLEEIVPIHFKNRISFHGYGNTNLQLKVYENSDIFVLPSAHDGWGMVVPEAMAAGLPVVTTYGVISGRDLIKNGENGFLVPVGDFEALKTILTKVMQCKVNLEKMGNNALRTVSKYSPDTVTDAFLKDISVRWNPKR